MDIMWIIGLSILTMGFTDGVRITLEGFHVSSNDRFRDPVTTVPPDWSVSTPDVELDPGFHDPQTPPNDPFQDPTVRPDGPVSTTDEDQNLRNAIRAAIYCEICRALGLTTCVSNFCDVPQQGGFITPGRNIISPFSLTGSASPRWTQSDPDGVIIPLSFSDLAAIYCAYCTEKGWQDCIDYYCFRRCTITPGDGRDSFVSAPAHCRNQDELHGFQPILTTPRPSRRVRMRASSSRRRPSRPSRPTRRQNGGTNNENLAQIFCKFCRLAGWRQCINHFCGPRTTPRPVLEIKPVTIRPPRGIRIRTRKPVILNTRRPPTFFPPIIRATNRPPFLIGSNRIPPRTTGSRPRITPSRPSRPSRPISLRPRLTPSRPTRPLRPTVVRPRIRPSRPSRSSRMQRMRNIRRRITSRRGRNK